MMYQLAREQLELRDAWSQAPVRAVPASARETGLGAEEDLEPVNVNQLGDPLGMYLRGMGRLSLLTREGEVELCREIEEGERMVLQTVLGSRLDIQSMVRLRDQIRNGEIDLGRLPVAQGDDEQAEKLISRAITKLRRLDLDLRRARALLASPSGRSSRRSTSCSATAER